MAKKSFWPLGIILVYGLFFLFLIGFLIFSRFQNRDLVVRDYYEQDQIYQQQIERVKRTRNLAEKIKINYDRVNQQITLQFPVEWNPSTISGQIHFFRPSEAKLDRMIPLNISKDRIQITDLRHFARGLWRMKIYWNFDGNEYYQEEVFTIE